MVMEVVKNWAKLRKCTEHEAMKEIQALYLMYPSKEKTSAGTEAAEYPTTGFHHQL